jgi:6-hydroxy-3-succinoylpyridine 3-monooxygenase
VTSPANAALRTRIYIDGYNFYYGCLKRTHYKWLDPVKLFEDSILPSALFESNGQPATFVLDELAVKYFTAPILKNFARSNDSVPSQAQYHAALEGHHQGRLEIIRGYYDAREASAHRVIAATPPTQCEKVDIWKLEEKQSDVNLALHAYRDAARKEIDHAVIVTNDTDLVPALELIKRDTGIAIGLVVPTRQGERSANADLTKRSDWVRTHITNQELEGSQLPRVVMHGRQAAHKPMSWYRRPDLVGPAIQEAIRVRGGRGAAMKWLGQPNERLGGQVPMEMLDTEEGAAQLRQYMTAWAAEHG